MDVYGSCSARSERVCTIGVAGASGRATDGGKVGQLATVGARNARSPSPARQARRCVGGFPVRCVRRVDRALSWWAGVVGKWVFGQTGACDAACARHGHARCTHAGSWCRNVLSDSAVLSLCAELSSRAQGFRRRWGAGGLRRCWPSAPRLLPDGCLECSQEGLAAGRGARVCCSEVETCDSDGSPMRSSSGQPAAGGQFADASHTLETRGGAVGGQTGCSAWHGQAWPGLPPLGPWPSA